MTFDEAKAFCDTAVKIVESLRYSELPKHQKLTLLSRIADSSDWHLNREKLGYADRTSDV